jgi:putative transposase
MAAIRHRKRVRHFHEPGDLHELTFSCYRRMPLLTNDVWREMLARAIDDAMTRLNFHLVAFVFMPEHVHLLVNPQATEPDLPGLLVALKQPYSGKIRRLLESTKAPLLKRLTIRERPGQICLPLLAGGTRLRSQPQFRASDTGVDQLPASQPGAAETVQEGCRLEMVECPAIFGARDWSRSRSATHPRLAR